MSVVTASGDATAGHDVRANAFDLLRLVAAFTVLVEHSWLLVGAGFPLLPEGSGTTIGGIGLGIFFLTSGYLILDSWLADPSPHRFAARRALRIAPLFVVVVVISALVLGPLLSTLPTGAYFTDPGTWGYIGSNLSLFLMEFDLPGVFTDAPHSIAVNGSLWTIPIEVLCYLGILLLGVTGVARRRWPVAALAVVPVGFLVAIGITGYEGTVIPRLLATNGAPLVAFFAVGMAVRTIRPGWRPTWVLTAVVALVWLYTWDTPVAGVLALATITLVTLTVAFAAPAVLHHPTGRNDLSYGVRPRLSGPADPRPGWDHLRRAEPDADRARRRPAGPAHLALHRTTDAETQTEKAATTSRDRRPTHLADQHLDTAATQR